MDKVIKSEEEWKKDLSPEQYKIMREKGTELPFSNKYYNFEGHGIYRCSACGNELFSSANKFKSGSGWPSFWATLSSDSVVLREDKTHGMMRTEVLCKRCESHLGHLFEDGPPPSGLRYCINSEALRFEEKKE